MSYKKMSCLRAMAASACFFGAASSHALAPEVADRMLGSTVYVQCLLEIGDKVAAGATGSGFLVGDADYVVTNHHVVAQCLPEMKISVVAEEIRTGAEESLEAKSGSAWDAFRGFAVAYLTAHPDDREKLGDPKFVDALKKAFLSGYVAKQTQAMAPLVEQKLSIFVLSPSDKKPIEIGVRTIVWDSKMSNDDARDSGVDLAVMHLDRPLAGRPIANFALGSTAHLGETVHSVGFPGGSNLPTGADRTNPSRYEATMKTGTVSKLGVPWDKDVTDAGKARNLKGPIVIESDATINHGNSGGPLFNDRGEVLGVNTWSAAKESNVFWAQDSAGVVPLLRTLNIRTGSVRERAETPFETWQNYIYVGGAAAFLLAVGAAFFMFRKKDVVATPSPRSPLRTDAGSAMLQPRAGRLKGMPAVRVPSQGLTIGRETDGQGRLKIPDKDVSFDHATVVYLPDRQRFEVTDLNSLNGTYLMPQKRKLAVGEKVEVGIGQVLRFGDTNEFELTAGR